MSVTTAPPAPIRAPRPEDAPELVSEPRPRWHHVLLIIAVWIVACISPGAPTPSSCPAATTPPCTRASRHSGTG